MRRPRSGAALAATLLLSAAAPLLAQEGTEAAPGPLADFGALAVGTWEGDGSRQVLEWSLGGELIRSRSYFGSGEEWTLVSEGMWFWDDEEGTVRGVVVATGMPISLFEYRSEVRDGRIVHDLTAQGPAGGDFVETWIFEGDGYRWTLEQETAEGTETLMGGSYRRAEGGG